VGKSTQIASALSFSQGSVKGKEGVSLLACQEVYAVLGTDCITEVSRQTVCHRESVPPPAGTFSKTSCRARGYRVKIRL